MPTGVYDDEDLDARERGPAKSHYNELVDPNHVKQGLDDLEKHANQPGSARVSDGPEASLFNPGTGSHAQAEGSGRGFKAAQRLRGIPGRFKQMSTGKKVASGVGVASLLVAGGIGIFSLMSFFNVFRLDHLMSNIEKKAFIRYQVSMDDRSSKWINAYIILRLGEVDDPNLAPQDRDNIIFRSNRVDTNSPGVDWYRSMRASKFEDQLAEKQGIKFASIAYKDGGSIKIRPAIITVNDKPIDLDLSDGEIRAIEDFDIGQLNGRLRNFVEVRQLGSDKEARKAIKEAVDTNTKSYQVAKRYFLRKSIQNMTGVRSWRLFEKTRNAASEKKIEIRNKVIAASVPETTKSGKIVRCLFGISECRGSTDPNDPETRSASALAEASCTDTPKPPACNTDVADDTPDDDVNDSIVNNGEAEAGLAEDTTKGLTSDVVKQVLGKLNLATSVVSIVDTLNIIDKNIKSGSITKTVYMARAAQAIGLFTTWNVARDQIRSGELSGDELGAFMEMVDGTGTSEGWNKVINTSTSINTVSAATNSESQSKKDYCSTEHQAEMAKPENKEKAEKEYHRLCDSEKIGSTDLAKTIENGWNESIGFAMAPVFKVYNGSGASKVVGILNNAIDAVLGPIINGVLKGLGIDDNVEALAAWAVTKAAEVLGAGTAVKADDPSGKMVNHVLMGGAASSEFAMRYMGGSATNDASADATAKAVATYTQDEAASASFSTKYLSLANPQSLFSTTLFNFSGGLDQWRGGSVFDSIASLPANLLSRPAIAAETTGYEAAKFAGVNTYDMPAACTDSNPLTMTPVEATNADEMGLIDPSELTWELLEDSDAFYGRLYEAHPEASEQINTVYDCAAFDSTVRGSLGAVQDSGLLGPNALPASGDEVESNGSALAFTVATYNVKHEIEHGGDCKLNACAEARSQRQANIILGKTGDNPAFDIVGTQEDSPPQHNRFKTMLTNYDTFPTTVPDHQGNAVYWNSEKFEKIDSGYINTINNVSKQFERPWVGLVSKASGHKIYVMSAHGPNKHFGTAEGRAKVAQDAYDWAKSISGSADTVIVMGDWNEPPEAGNGYCILTTAGVLQKADDMQANEDPSKACPNKRPGTIDQIYASPTSGLTASGWKHPAEVPPYSGASDHSPTYVTFDFPGAEATDPGSEDVSKDGWVWPVALSDYTGLNQCWNNLYASLGRHAGLDIDANSGTKLYAAHDGVVVWYKTDGAAGNNLLIDAGNGLWYNYQHLTSAKVSVGQEVKAGDLVATSGNTGRSGGPHLHFGVSVYAGVGSYGDNSQTRNPLNYLPKDRDTGPC